MDLCQNSPPDRTRGDCDGLEDVVREGNPGLGGRCALSREANKLVIVAINGVVRREQQQQGLPTLDVISRSDRC